MVIGTAPPIPIQETIHDVLGMQIFLIRSDHGGEPRTLRGVPLGAMAILEDRNFAMAKSYLPTLLLI
jgi:hypothetical protein